jgi:hypothetical protein
MDFLNEVELFAQNPTVQLLNLIFFPEMNYALQNIHTGKLADESSSQCLLNIVGSGEIALSTYENERSALKSKKLFDPIKKLNWQVSNYFWKWK